MYEQAICLSSLAVFTGFMVSSLDMGHRCRERLRRAAEHAEAPRRRIGLLAVIAQAHAYIRSGGHPSRAFTDGHGHALGRAPLDAAWLRVILSERAYAHEDTRHIESVAADISLALRCSEQLGCRLTRCLEAVSDSYRSSVTLEELKKSAFAMPQATVRLLSLLPVGTVLLGEVLNARPLAFLFGSTQGFVCLISGALAYSSGLVWMRSLLRSVTLQALTDDDAAERRSEELA